MWEGRGHVRGSKVLDEEVRRSIGDCSRRKSSPLHALVGAVRCEGVCRGSKGSSLGGARDCVRSYYEVGAGRARSVEGKEVLGRNKKGAKKP